MLKWTITYTYLSKIIIITYKNLLDPDCLFGIHNQQGSFADWQIWLMWIFFDTLTRDNVSSQTEANSIRILITSTLVHDIFLSSSPSGLPCLIPHHRQQNPPFLGFAWMIRTKHRTAGHGVIFRLIYFLCGCIASIMQPTAQSAWNNPVSKNWVNLLFHLHFHIYILCKLKLRKKENLIKQTRSSIS